MHLISNHRPDHGSDNDNHFETPWKMQSIFHPAPIWVAACAKRQFLDPGVDSKCIAVAWGSKDSIAATLEKKSLSSFQRITLTTRDNLPWSKKSSCGFAEFPPPHPRSDSASRPVLVYFSLFLLTIASSEAMKANSNPTPPLPSPPSLPLYLSSLGFQSSGRKAKDNIIWSRITNRKDEECFVT